MEFFYIVELVPTIMITDPKSLYWLESEPPIGQFAKRGISAGLLICQELNGLVPKALMTRNPGSQCAARQSFE